MTEITKLTIDELTKEIEEFTEEEQRLLALSKKRQDKFKFLIPDDTSSITSLMTDNKNRDKNKNGIEILDGDLKYGFLCYFNDLKRINYINGNIACWKYMVDNQSRLEQMIARSNINFLSDTLFGEIVENCQTLIDIHIKLEIARDKITRHKNEKKRKEEIEKESELL